MSDKTNYLLMLVLRCTPSLLGREHSPAKSTDCKRKSLHATAPTRRAGGSPRSRASIRSPRQLSRCVAVPIRPPVCGTARTHASSEQLWGQGTPGRDHQARLWLPAKAACGRRDRSDAYDAQKRRSAALDGAAPRAEARKDRDSRARQQTARIAWAVMSRKEVYAAPAA